MTDPEKTVEDRAAGRFVRGNQAAVGSMRGRPRLALARLMDRTAERSIRAVAKIAFDKADPDHDKYRFAALLALMKVCTPRRKEISGARGEQLTVLDAQRLIFRDAPGADHSAD